MQSLNSLGKMTIFYIPSHKLDAPGPVGEHTPRGKIHEFLIQHYRAYTPHAFAGEGILAQRAARRHARRAGAV